jgi:hypothetical protein
MFVEQEIDVGVIDRSMLDVKHLQILTMAPPLKVKKEKKVISESKK